jgi:DNA recombination-dependent growth factor C
MPIRRGSVNLARFRLAGALPKDVKRWLQRALEKAAFEPIDLKGDDERASGFVELEAPERTEFAAGALFHGLYALFAWRVDTLKVKSSAVRAGLLQWSQAFEQKNGRPPGRRERAEQKDTLKRALRAKQDPVTKVFEVSVDLTTRDVFVWATSRKVVDDVAAALEAALELKLVPRVPAAFLEPEALDALSPTKALFGEAA